METTTNGPGRRRVLLGAGGAVATAMLAGAAAGSAAAAPQVPAGRPVSGKHLARQLQDIEREHDARLGLMYFEPGRRIAFGYGQTQRFALCSTFKAYAAAALLDARDAGTVDLHEPVAVGSDGLVVNSPESEDFDGYSMPLRWCCKVALTHSDNTAGNVMLKHLGGPGAVTRFARRIGDRQTRLDRWEPELNDAVPGDPRDTSTPLALATGMKALLFGRALSTASRKELIDWMDSNVSAPRIRGGLPEGWTAATKTGAGFYGTVNDAGLVRGPDDRQGILAVMSNREHAGREATGSNAVVAAAARAVLTAHAH
ncbi:class A beta-lactamase [Micrococcaceae bacterium RIT802]|nr:class A beta-lactamase [Micrococcaceae bacterium RIT 802]